MLVAKATPRILCDQHQGPVPKCIVDHVMGQRLVGVGLDLQEIITAHQPAEQEQRKRLPDNTKMQPPIASLGPKWGGMWKSWGEEKYLDLSFPPSSCLLLTPLTDHNQSATRGQGCSLQQDADNRPPDHRLTKRDGDGRGCTGRNPHRGQRCHI